MEELIDVLEKENALYEQLLALSMKKTPVIISANLEDLQRITDAEQEVVGQINVVDRKRTQNMKDIANVINRDVQTVKIADLIEMLKTRPNEQKKLAEVYDKLSDTIAQMRQANEHNRELLNNSLEMVEFDMKIMQAYKAAPETANYTKGAYNAGTFMGTNRGGFDAKQ